MHPTYVYDVGGNMFPMFDASSCFDRNNDDSHFNEAIQNFNGGHHSPGIHNPVKLHLEQDATYKDFSYHLDALGSVRSLTDSDGNTAVSYKYTPYGEMTTTNGTDNDAKANHNTFTARDYETSFMMFYRSRFYGNRMGRFYIKDTYPPSYERPISQNRYLYVEGNSVNFVDPFGTNRMGNQHDRKFQIDPFSNTKKMIYIPAPNFNVIIEDSPSSTLFCGNLCDENTANCDYKNSIKDALVEVYQRISANPGQRIAGGFRLQYFPIFQNIRIECPYIEGNTCMETGGGIGYAGFSINTQYYHVGPDNVLRRRGEHCHDSHFTILHELTHFLMPSGISQQEECKCDICGFSLFSGEVGAVDACNDLGHPLSNSWLQQSGVCNPDLNSWPWY